MKVLYGGASGCDIATFKRLLLIADEIAFIDRPSVMFGSWGMVGEDSWYRRIESRPEDPVKLEVHRAPGGPPSALLTRYIEPDLQDMAFRKTFLDGLRDDRFASKFLILDGDYGQKRGEIKGRQIVDALLADESLRHGPIDPQVEMDERDRSHDLGDPHVLRRLLGRHLMTASVHVTTAMITAEGASALPVSDDPYFGQLVALRAGLPSYVGGVPQVSPYLGLEIMRAVIPDDVLARLEVPDVLRYRVETAEAQRAWIVEVNEIAARIDDLKLSDLADRLPRILTVDVHPRVEAFRAELRSVRDRLFGDIVKGLFSWKLPTFSLVAVSSLNLPAAMAAFAGLGASTLPAVVDYYVGRRAARRAHTVSYVVGVTGELGVHWDDSPGVIRPQF